MRLNIKNYRFLQNMFVFLSFPILIYLLEDFPRRTLLKELISVITIMSFSLMLYQFFLSRGNQSLRNRAKMSYIVKTHKFIGYVFTGILILHPALIVFPRYFEGGIRPLDALWKILTTTNNAGIVTGIIAWGIMLLLIITSLMRDKLFANYRIWRIFHGILSLLFIGLAEYHVFRLGRHSNLSMKAFYLLTGIGSAAMLGKIYLRDFGKKKEIKKWNVHQQEIQLADDNL